MSKIIDLQKYRKNKLLEEKAGPIENISNEELLSILMGVMSSDPPPGIDEEAEAQAKKDFEMSQRYTDGEDICRCLFCGSVISRKDGDGNKE